LLFQKNNERLVILNSLQVILELKTVAKSAIVLAALGQSGSGTFVRWIEKEPKDYIAF